MKNINGYDVIGDIHGQADKLDALLTRMGYTPRGQGWVPPQGRQAIFLGDLIDRGPAQRKVVGIVRDMIDAGHARCVMGNHEFNALGFATERAGSPGEFLRPHIQKNLDQHKEFLAQVGQGSAAHREMLDWFLTLPPMLDLGGIRVVHAWWHQPYVDLVSGHLPTGVAMGDEFLQMAYARHSPEWHALEGLTKGLEISLPRGHSFTDHAKVERQEVRTRWWKHDARTFREVAIVDPEQLDSVPDLPLPETFRPQPVEGSPIFVGHYWFKGKPGLESPKVACVDYSAAGDGPLVAYRWDGEPSLSDRKFITSSDTH